MREQGWHPGPNRQAEPASAATTSDHREVPKQAPAYGNIMHQQLTTTLLAGRVGTTAHTARQPFTLPKKHSLHAQILATPLLCTQVNPAIDMWDRHCSSRACSEHESRPHGT